MLFKYSWLNKACIIGSFAIKVERLIELPLYYGREGEPRISKSRSGRAEAHLSFWVPHSSRSHCDKRAALPLSNPTAPPNPSASVPAASGSPASDTPRHPSSATPAHPHPAAATPPAAKPPTHPSHPGKQQSALPDSTPPSTSSSPPLPTRPETASPAWRRAAARHAPRSASALRHRSRSANTARCSAQPVRQTPSRRTQPLTQEAHLIRAQRRLLLHQHLPDRLHQVRQARNHSRLLSSRRINLVLNPDQDTHSADPSQQSGTAQRPSTS